MRTVIYALVMATVALGLLLFDDVQVGLPILNIAVWSMVGMAGLFLIARRRVRSRGSAPRHPRLRQADFRHEVKVISHY